MQTLVGFTLDTSATIELYAGNETWETHAVLYVTQEDYDGRCRAFVRLHAATFSPSRPVPDDLKTQVMEIVNETLPKPYYTTEKMLTVYHTTMSPINGGTEVKGAFGSVWKREW